MNKETLQEYNTRLSENNNSLDDILTTINNLPERGTGGGSLDIYSTEETVIGTYLDKPLYRKIFTSFEVNHIPQEWTRLLSLEGMNIEQITRSSLLCRGGHTTNTPIEQHLYYLQLTNDNEVLNIWGPYLFSNIHSLTLEYTKTTD